MEKTKIEVGTGATMCMYTDSHAYTVIEVVSANCVHVQRDKVTLKDGEPSYEANPEGTILIVTKRKDGVWRVRGDTQKFIVGSRYEYRDPSF